MFPWTPFLAVYIYIWISFFAAMQDVGRRRERWVGRCTLPKLPTVPGCCYQGNSRKTQPTSSHPNILPQNRTNSRNEIQSRQNFTLKNKILICIKFLVLGESPVGWTRDIRFYSVYSIFISRWSGLNVYLTFIYRGVGSILNLQFIVCYSNFLSQIFPLRKTSDMHHRHNICMNRVIHTKYDIKDV